MRQDANRVLFIDDEAFFTRSYIDALLDDGLDVIVAESVDDAIDLAQAECIHVVVMDVMMPTGDFFEAIETAGGFKTGIALARELRNWLPEAPIVALTMSTDPEVEAWFTQDDSVAYLYKADALPSRLTRTVRRALRRDMEPLQVFIVHGRDRETLVELKGFIKNELHLGEPIVLAEKPSRGMTIIEKFEYYASDVDIVFVLFTPDDIGHLADNPNSATARPRMNVVFEYGYFLGALRRHSGRIFMLYKGSLEIPSDLSGIVYIDISDGIEASGNRIRSELADWL